MAGLLWGPTSAGGVCECVSVWVCECVNLPTG